MNAEHLSCMMSDNEQPLASVNTMTLMSLSLLDSCHPVGILESTQGWLEGQFQDDSWRGHEEAACTALKQALI